MSGFERTHSEEVWKGRITAVRIDEFRYEDGETASREIVSRPGVVAIVAHDGDRLFLVRQPREPVGEPDLLEIPAGKLDEEGETPLETAKRELAEEVGKVAADWTELKRYYASPGFADEEVIVYLASGLSDAPPESAETTENERIEVVTVPLGDLDGVIEECRDAKSLIGLLLYRSLRADDA